MSRNYSKLILACSAIALSGSAIATVATAQDARVAPQAVASYEAMRTISVTGTGTASARPDMASITFSVEARGDSAADALAANSRQMRDAMAALKRAGVEDKDLQTTGIYLNTVNGRDENGRWTEEIDYYEARNSLVATIRDVDETGDVIDAAVKAGINGLGGIQFGFSDDAGLMDEARREAIDNARSKAQLYAAAAGVDLGDLILITEPGSAAGPQPMYRVQMQAAEASPAPPIAAGENSVSASVTLVYAIN